MKLEVVILAAGQGTRMHSDLPKVLHPLAGKPLLGHVIECARALSPHEIHVVTGHGTEQVRGAIDGERITWHLQEEQRGTGHAVQQALPVIADEHVVLVLYGDVPLLESATLQALLQGLSHCELVLLTAQFEGVEGLGRIVRDAEGRVLRIVEQCEANPEILAIREMNTGVLAARAGRLKQWLAQVGNDNTQKEFYLTDCIGLATKGGYRVEALLCEAADTALGVNDKAQLAQAERACQRRMARQLMEQGVTLMDPARIDVRGELQVGRDVEIDVNAVFEGRNHLGDGVCIGANSVLINTIVGAGTRIHASSHVEEAEIGSQCSIGPFARIRPQTRLSDHVKVGNFVEIKKSDIGANSKVSHLSYLGDAELGADVNVGAGTITCNYDGAHKHRTVIRDRVFVGSNTQLVAPVIVGEGATIAAGSTITKDVPAEVLAVARSKQVTVEHWKRPEKDEG